MASIPPIAIDEDEECLLAPPLAAPTASPMAVDRPPQPDRALDCRSFWKAGGYEVPTGGLSHGVENAILGSSDFDCARVHPKFLHTNATSHKWAFGAVAELLDNAVDEIQNGATFIKVDKLNNLKDNSPMLLFQDDGGGMDPDGIRKCMSLGFSSKRSKTTIGQYGNGFKTSTMRLGADAIVFSRAIRGSHVTMCIGLLSFTYLRRTMKDDIVIPMLDFEVVNGQPIAVVSSSQEDWDYSLKTIVEWSPFSSQDELLNQFEDIGLHGTKVLIYNLWMNDDGLLELDFDDDDEDILLRDQANYGGFTKFDKEEVKSHVSYTMKYSLRAYTSILYLRKFSNFQIILRGKPVEQLRISDLMKFQKTSTYKPQVGVDSQDVSVRITVGFAKEAPTLGIFGLNVYHRNRLIMPFWKVVQEGSSRGRSVIGYLEANFIEPAHDKQDFERTPLFIRLETKLRQIILDYWKNNCHQVGYQSSAVTSEKQKLRKPGEKIHNKVSGSSNVNGIATSLDQEIETEEQVNGQVAGQRTNELNTRVTGVAAADGSILPTGHQQSNVEEVEEVVSGEDFEDIGTLDITDPSILQKITEENLQLFLRREELQQKEAELRKTIVELEQELEETKKRCSQLTMKLDVRKKQQLLK